MKTSFIIVNPVSGKGEAQLRLQKLIPHLRARHYAVCIHRTQGHRMSVELKRFEDRHLDLVVCLGGDGTISQVGNWMRHHHPNTPLWTIPTGTTNDIPKSLRLSRFWKGQLAEFDELSSRKIDMATCNGHTFFYVAAFGALVNTSSKTSQPLKNRLGRLAYFLSAIQELGSSEHRVVIRADGKTHTGRYVLGMVCNSRSVGGISLHRYLHDIHLDDGRLEVILIPKPKQFIEGLNWLCAIICRRMPKSVVVMRAKHIEIYTDISLPWTLDGEDMPNMRKATIDPLSQAITVLTKGTL